MQSPKNAILAPFWAQKALSGSLPPTIRLNYWWFWNIQSIVGLPSRALCAAPTCKENVMNQILWSRPGGAFIYWLRSGTSGNTILEKMKAASFDIFDRILSCVLMKRTINAEGPLFIGLDQAQVVTTPYWKR